MPVPVLWLAGACEPMQSTRTQIQFGWETTVKRLCKSSPQNHNVGGKLDSYAPVTVQRLCSAKGWDNYTAECCALCCRGVLSSFSIFAQDWHEWTQITWDRQLKCHHPLQYPNRLVSCSFSLSAQNVQGVWHLAAVIYLCCAAEWSFPTAGRALPAASLRQAILRAYRDLFQLLLLKMQQQLT